MFPDNNHPEKTPNKIKEPANLAHKQTFILIPRYPCMAFHYKQSMSGTCQRTTTPAKIPHRC
jgi:hypothetical protein